MTELELYKFVKDNNIEWHRSNNAGDLDIIMFVELYNLKEFSKLIKSMLDEPVDCKMRDGYLCFWMNDMCGYYGIDPDVVFTGEEK